MTRAVSVLLCLGLASASGVAADFARAIQEYPAVQESLEHVPRKQRAWWLERHGFDASRYTTYQRPETTGLRLVGKWGRGPSGEVTGQDSLMALTLGSECALLSIANPDRPQVLSEIQLDYLPHQSLLKNSLLLTGGNGIQIWDIADPSQPVQVSEIPYAIGDFSIVDTFLYFVGNDTFFAYSFANPDSPRCIGFCPDSGYVTTATQSTAVLIRPNDVLGFVDVSDPTRPHQVGTWPAWSLAAAARGNLCCAAFSNPSNQFESWFLTLDISDPANPRQLARLDSVCGYDVYLAETLAFVSGRSDAYEGFRIVNIADSTQLRKLGTCDVWNDNWGVWADPQRNRAYIASEPSGLAVVNIADLNAPHVDTCVLTADQAEDVWVDDDRAYVSDYRAGFRILDVSDPTHPTDLGGFDSLHMPVDAAVARDSFAFVSWWAPPYFRAFDVSDPVHPVAAGGGLVETTPEDMVLRDTLVYLAGRLRFNVVNVARPREPVLAGSCVIGDATSASVSIRETLAYVGNFVGDVVNVRDPANPQVVGRFGRGAWNVSVRDTFAFVSCGGILVYSVADPGEPTLIDSFSVGSGTYWVEAAGSLLYTGHRDGVRVIDASDVHNMRVRGFRSTPYTVKRLTYATPHIFASCWDAGVCIFESTQVGVRDEVTDTRPAQGYLRVVPSPAIDCIALTSDGHLGGKAAIVVRDVTGREVMRPNRAAILDLPARINVAGLARGIYFVEVTDAGRRASAVFIKQ